MKRLLAAALLALGLAHAAPVPPILSDGTVRKVNPATGKVTLKHGEIRNLDMPPMTMVFTARDRTLLKHLKPGDQVRFAAEQDAKGELFITAIQPRH